MAVRYGKAKTRWLKRMQALSPHDRAEVERFEAFLRASAVLPKAELHKKHAEYLGLAEPPRTGELP